MLKCFQQLFAVMQRTEFDDPVFGLLVSEHDGTWRGEIPLSGRQVLLLMPVTRITPDAARLAHAHGLIANLADLVAQALQFAVERQRQPDWQASNDWAPKLDCSLLVFVGLNYSSASSSGFTLDFVQHGDASGNCWQVHFDSGRPTELEYT